MVMAVFEPWGICIPPPARVRGDPLPKGWTWLGGHAMRVPDRPAILRDGLPEERDLRWWQVNRALAAEFASSMRYKIGRPASLHDLRIAHPHNEAQIEAIRAVYNDEVPEPDGGSLPRVWKWEHEGQLWWVVELPPHLEWAWRSLGV